MRKRIGEFLVEKGVLSVQQVKKVLTLSQQTGMRFGDAAIQLGLLSREKLLEILGSGSSKDFFYLEPAFFPKITQNLIPTDWILKFGAVPLGFKMERRFFSERKVLNIGLLDPENKVTVQAIENRVREKMGKAEFQGVQIYLVLPDQFVNILNQVYGIPTERLASMESQDLDEVLAMYLEGLG